MYALLLAISIDILHYILLFRLFARNSHVYIHMQISPFIDFLYRKNVCISDVDILRNTYINVIYSYDLHAVVCSIVSR